METKKSCETSIKPSSPTPSHLRTYKISLLDQFLLSIDSPMILCYSNQHCSYGPANLIASEGLISKRSQLLKQSLFQTLTHYYPLAGRTKGSLSIDCNDEGVYYVQAQTNFPLSELFSHPDLTSMNSFLPRQANWFEPSSPGSYVAMIQETTFSYGSITIGLLVQHMVMDSAALASFVKAWANVFFNSSKETIHPNFEGPSIFPQFNAFPRDATPLAFYELFLQAGKLASRRLVFDEMSIEKLKTHAITSCVENPTRVEIVSALFLKCISAIRNVRSSIYRPVAFTHIVNLRRKAMPPLLQSSFGNFIWIAPGLRLPKETKLTTSVYKVREAIRKVDADFVKNIHSDGGFYMLHGIIKETGSSLTSSTFSNGVDFVMITGVCSFGLYGIDFGWGKPAWVATVFLPPHPTIFINTVIIADLRRGKGIEAWVLMEEEELVLLEKYEELLAHASVNPSPLKPVHLVSRL